MIGSKTFAIIKQNDQQLLAILTADTWFKVQEIKNKTITLQLQQ